MIFNEVREASHTWAPSTPLRGKELGGWEVADPANKISTLIRKDVSRGTRKFSQNSANFACVIRIRICVAGIFSGKRPSQLKGYPGPPQGVGGCSPTDVGKLKILKRFEVLENDSIFQKITTYLLAEKSPFS